MTTTQPNSEPQWLRKIESNQQQRRTVESTFREHFMVRDIDKLIAEYKAMKAERDATDAAKQAAELVQQLAQIDGPCSCESPLCDHWKSEAGIILTAALVRLKESK